MEHEHAAHGMQAKHTHGGHYLRLLVMIGLSFAAMYALMYAMVDRAENIHPSLNQAYMAGLMVAPMAVLELLLMGSMYPDRRLNLWLGAGFTLLFVVAFLAIRMQSGIGDRQFLRSMIPHHSGAILMCREANVEDAEIRALCTRIIASQSEEIAQMEAILARR